MYRVGSTACIGLGGVALGRKSVTGVGSEVSKPLAIPSFHSLPPTCSSRCEFSASVPATTPETCCHDGLLF